MMKLIDFFFEEEEQNLTSHPQQGPHCVALAIQPHYTDWLDLISHRFVGIKDVCHRAWPKT